MLSPACACPQTDAHDGERFRRGEDGGVTRPGVIGMAVRDKGMAHRSPGVDVEVANPAIQAGVRVFKHRVGCIKSGHAVMAPR